MQEHFHRGEIFGWNLVVLWLLKNREGNSISTGKHLKPPVIVSASTIVWKILEKCKARITLLHGKEKVFTAGCSWKRRRVLSGCHWAEWLGYVHWSQDKKNWLHHQVKRVVLNGTKSSWWPVQSDIPQVQQCSISVIWIGELSVSSVHVQVTPR